MTSEALAKRIEEVSRLAYMEGHMETACILYTLVAVTLDYDSNALTRLADLVSAFAKTEEARVLERMKGGN